MLYESESFNCEELWESLLLKIFVFNTANNFLNRACSWNLLLQFLSLRSLLSDVLRLTVPNNFSVHKLMYSILVYSPTIIIPKYLKYYTIRELVE